MANSPPLLWRQGIQARFLLAFASVVVVAMAALGTALFLSQRQITLNRYEQEARDLNRVLQEKANTYSTLLARLAPQGMLTHDYLLLEGYIEEFSADTDLAYAVILNRRSQPITHFLKKSSASPGATGQARVEPRQFSEILAKVRADPSLLIARRDVIYIGEVLGHVELGLSQTKVATHLEELKEIFQQRMNRIALLTGSIILITLAVLILLSQRIFHRLVARPIQALGIDMERVRSGDLGVRAQIDREDELGWLAHGFNAMAADLQDHVHKIEVQRRTYKETRDYLANIFDNSADMIATTALDGSLVEFNSAAERTLGFRRDEVVGKDSSSFYYDPNVRKQLYKTVSTGMPVQNAEIQLRRKDGGIIDAELTLSLLRNNAGNPIGTVCIGRDITHAKAMRRDLIQAEKMATVGQVSAWIAHQIRNSLGRILMSASALRPNREAAASRQQAHRDLTSSIAEMDNIVSDLLDYSRTLSLHPTRANLNTALNDLLDTLVADGVNGRHRVECAFDPDLPRVQIDVFKMEQALGNVLKNAMQAMPDQGTLRVETRRGPGERQVTVVVQDSGAGIARENLQNVFRPFFTTKPGGTGLGLAITSRIVEAHGGHVTVESAEGRGATFTFVLPETPTQ